jgi:hypothetical protein
MPGWLGIGVVTSDWGDALSQTLAAVRTHTGHLVYTLAVAGDGGGQDGAVASLRAAGVAVVTGTSAGDAWNRNRVLFLLGAMLGCEVVIVLTAGFIPAGEGWEADLIAAARRDGHAGDASGGCMAVSAEALAFGGYLDLRLPESLATAEHAARLLDPVGNGPARATDPPPPATPIGYGVTIAAPPAAIRLGPAPTAVQAFFPAACPPVFIPPWRGEPEFMTFRAEINEARRFLPAAPAAPLRLGIGVITRNRRDTLAATLARVRAHTTHPGATLLVADDGSTDDTLAMLQAEGTPVVTGRTTGVAWNKNRALFMLTAVLARDVVILLEDDAFPLHDGWEQAWLQAAQRHGHVNIAGDWFRDASLSGAGTPDDPLMSKSVSAQCSAFTREALLFGGYMDSRFGGYGFEHVEHTRRLIRLGYGGAQRVVDGVSRPVFTLITGGVGFAPSESFRTDAQVTRNERLCQVLVNQRGYRAPWRTLAELAQFRAEIGAARSAIPGGAAWSPQA